MKTSFTLFKLFFFSLAVGTLLSTSCLAETTSPRANTQTPYPLSTCVVSGDKLGEMGKPVIVNHEGTEVRFCCKDCVQDFNKDPEKYLKRLHETAAEKKE